MLKKKIGERVKHYRNLKNVTQYQLAEKTDVSVETIYNCEAGRKISINLLDKISTALSIPIKELFDYEILKNNDSLLKEIDLLCQDKSEKQLEYIIDIIKMSDKYIK